MRKQNGRGPHVQKREIPEPDQRDKDTGYRVVVMPIEVGARGIIGSSVYDLLTKLSIFGNKRTKALKLLAEFVENNYRRISSRNQD